jgi:hemoglobin
LASLFAVSGMMLVSGWGPFRIRSGQPPGWSAFWRELGLLGTLSCVTRSAVSRLPLAHAGARDFVMKISAPFQYRAKESGLTAELVRHVIVLFYEKIRRDNVLGPIFEEAIGQDWDSHIERIVQFWLTATRLGAGYDGKNFMPAHLKHRSIHTSQIPRWLELFRETTIQRCHPEGALVLIDIAERMAETLEIGLARHSLEHISTGHRKRRERT